MRFHHLEKGFWLINLILIHNFYNLILVPFLLIIYHSFIFQSNLPLLVKKIFNFSQFKIILNIYFLLESYTNSQLLSLKCLII